MNQHDLFTSATTQIGVMQTCLTLLTIRTSRLTHYLILPVVGNTSLNQTPGRLRAALFVQRRLQQCSSRN